MPRPPSVLWTAPWRRAPLLLRRSPAVLLAVLRQVVHDRGAACLAATHDPDARRFADRVLHLADGELTERSP
jgi:ABC-type lipoprotein export system ATPase subunit